MKKKLLLTLAGLALAFAGWLVGLVPQSPLGSIEASSAYNATTTDSTGAAAATSWVAMTGQGTFGSIIINQPATEGYVRVWNATSTATSTYQTPDVKNATFTIGRPIAYIVNASDVVGTYVYDIAVEKGLVIETAADFNGSYTITFRK